jgi:hypothetical protein
MHICMNIITAASDHYCRSYIQPSTQKRLTTLNLRTETHRNRSQASGRTPYICILCQHGVIRCLCNCTKLWEAPTAPPTLQCASGPPTCREGRFVLHSQEPWVRLNSPSLLQQLSSAGRKIWSQKSNSEQNPTTEANTEHSHVPLCYMT